MAEYLDLTARHKKYYRQNNSKCQYGRSSLSGSKCDAELPCPVLVSYISRSRNYNDCKRQFDNVGHKSQASPNEQLVEGIENLLKEKSRSKIVDEFGNHVNKIDYAILDCEEFQEDKRDSKSLIQRVEERVSTGKTTVVSLDSPKKNKRKTPSSLGPNTLRKPQFNSTSSPDQVIETKLDGKDSSLINDKNKVKEDNTLKRGDSNVKSIRKGISEMTQNLIIGSDKKADNQNLKKEENKNETFQNCLESKNEIEIGSQSQIPKRELKSAPVFQSVDKNLKSTLKALDNCEMSPMSEASSPECNTSDHKKRKRRRRKKRRRRRKEEYEIPNEEDGDRNREHRRSSYLQISGSEETSYVNPFRSKSDTSVCESTAGRARKRKNDKSVKGFIGGMFSNHRTQSCGIFGIFSQTVGNCLTNIANNHGRYHFPSRQQLFVPDLGLGSKWLNPCRSQNQFFRHPVDKVTTKVDHEASSPQCKHILSRYEREEERKQDQLFLSPQGLEGPHSPVGIEGTHHLLGLGETDGEVWIARDGDTATPARIVDYRNDSFDGKTNHAKELCNVYDAIQARDAARSTQRNSHRFSESLQGYGPVGDQSLNKSPDRENPPIRKRHSSKQKATSQHRHRHHHSDVDDGDGIISAKDSNTILRKRRSRYRLGSCNKRSNSVRRNSFSNSTTEESSHPSVVAIEEDTSNYRRSTHRCGATKYRRANLTSLQSPKLLPDWDVTDGQPKCQSEDDLLLSNISRSNQRALPSDSETKIFENVPFDRKARPTITDGLRVDDLGFVSDCEESYSERLMKPHDKKDDKTYPYSSRKHVFVNGSTTESVLPASSYSKCYQDNKIHRSESETTTSESWPKSRYGVNGLHKTKTTSYHSNMDSNNCFYKNNQFSAVRNRNSAYFTESCAPNENSDEEEVNILNNKYLYGEIMELKRDVDRLSGLSESLLSRRSLVNSMEDRNISLRSNSDNIDYELCYDSGESNLRSGKQMLNEHRQAVVSRHQNNGAMKANAVGVSNGNVKIFTAPGGEERVRNVRNVRSGDQAEFESSHSKINSDQQTSTLIKSTSRSERKSACSSYQNIEEVNSEPGQNKSEASNQIIYKKEHSLRSDKVFAAYYLCGKEDVKVRYSRKPLKLRSHSTGRCTWGDSSDKENDIRPVSEPNTVLIHSDEYNMDDKIDAFHEMIIPEQPASVVKRQIGYSKSFIDECMLRLNGKGNSSRPAQKPFCDDEIDGDQCRINGRRNHAQNISEKQGAVHSQSTNNNESKYFINRHEKKSRSLVKSKPIDHTLLSTNQNSSTYSPMIFNNFKRDIFYPQLAYNCSLSSSLEKDFCKSERHGQKEAFKMDNLIKSGSHTDVSIASHITLDKSFELDSCVDSLSSLSAVCGDGPGSIPNKILLFSKTMENWQAWSQSWGGKYVKTQTNARDKHLRKRGRRPKSLSPKKLPNRVKYTSSKHSFRIQQPVHSLTVGRARKQNNGRHADQISTPKCQKNDKSQESFSNQDLIVDHFKTIEHSTLGVSRGLSFESNTLVIDKSSTSIDEPTFADTNSDVFYPQICQTEATSIEPKTMTLYRGSSILTDEKTIIMDKSKQCMDSVAVDTLAGVNSLNDNLCTESNSLITLRNNLTRNEESHFKSTQRGQLAFSENLGTNVSTNHCFNIDNYVQLGEKESKNEISTVSKASHNSSDLEFDFPNIQTKGNKTSPTGTFLRFLCDKNLFGDDDLIHTVVKASGAVSSNPSNTTLNKTPHSETPIKKSLLDEKIFNFDEIKGNLCGPEVDFLICSTPVLDKNCQPQSPTKQFSIDKNGFEKREIKLWGSNVDTFSPSHTKNHKKHQSKSPQKQPALNEKLRTFDEKKSKPWRSELDISNCSTHTSDKIVASPESPQKRPFLLRYLKPFDEGADKHLEGSSVDGSKCSTPLLDNNSHFASPHRIPPLNGTFKTVEQDKSQLWVSELKPIEISPLKYNGRELINFCPSLQILERSTQSGRDVCWDSAPARIQSNRNMEVKESSFYSWIKEKVNKELNSITQSENETPKYFRFDSKPIGDKIPVKDQNSKGKTKPTKSNRNFKNDSNIVLSTSPKRTVQSISKDQICTDYSDFNKNDNLKYMELMQNYESEINMQNNKQMSFPANSFGNMGLGRLVNRIHVKSQQTNVKSSLSDTSNKSFRSTKEENIRSPIDPKEDDEEGEEAGEFYMFMSKYAKKSTPIQRKNGNKKKLAESCYEIRPQNSTEKNLSLFKKFRRDHAPQFEDFDKCCNCSSPIGKKNNYKNHPGKSCPPKPKKDNRYRNQSKSYYDNKSHGVIGDKLLLSQSSDGKRLSRREEFIMSQGDWNFPTFKKETNFQNEIVESSYDKNAGEKISIVHNSVGKGEPFSTELLIEKYASLLNEEHNYKKESCYEKKRTNFTENNATLPCSEELISDKLVQKSNTSSEFKSNFLKNKEIPYKSEFMRNEIHGKSFESHTYDARKKFLTSYRQENDRRPNNTSSSSKKRDMDFLNHATPSTYGYNNNSYMYSSSYNSCYNPISQRNSSNFYHDRYRLNSENRYQPSFRNNYGNASYLHKSKYEDTFNNDAAMLNMNQNSNNGEDEMDRLRSQAGTSSGGGSCKSQTLASSDYMWAHSSTSLGNSFLNNSRTSSSRTGYDVSDDFTMSNDFALCACKNINGSGNMIGSLPHYSQVSQSLGYPMSVEEMRMVGPGNRTPAGDEECEIDPLTDTVIGEPCSSLAAGGRAEIDATSNHPSHTSRYMGDGAYCCPRDDIHMKMSPCCSRTDSYKTHPDIPRHSYKDSHRFKFSETFRKIKDNYMIDSQNCVAIPSNQGLALHPSYHGQGDTNSQRVYTEWYVTDQHDRDTDLDVGIDKRKHFSSSSEGNKSRRSSVRSMSSAESCSTSSCSNSCSVCEVEEQAASGSSAESESRESSEYEASIEGRVEEDRGSNTDDDEWVDDTDDDDAASETYSRHRRYSIIKRRDPISVIKDFPGLSSRVCHNCGSSGQDLTNNKHESMVDLDLTAVVKQAGLHSGKKSDKGNGEPTGRPLKEDLIAEDDKDFMKKTQAVKKHKKFSFDHITVPSIDKERVRFACSEQGEWAEIGRGSYGCVYLGLLDGSVEVAIKDFYESSSWDLVIHEARMLLFLQDTGITPSFYGLRRRFNETKEPSEYCIIMEYFGDGRTLFNVMSDKIALAPDEWLDVVGQLVAGLRLIHSKQVLINDLKADNILIDLSHNRKTIRYIDVGMATYKQGLTFQLPKDQMNKYNFLAPEVREGGHTSTKSDIYSLGYMLDQILRLAGPSLSGLDKLVRRCLDKDPKNRPNIDEIVSQVHWYIVTKSHSHRSNKTQEVFPSNSV